MGKKTKKSKEIRKQQQIFYLLRDKSRRSGLMTQPQIV